MEMLFKRNIFNIVIFFGLSCVILETDGHFLGGTVSWVLLGNKGVRFTYRMAWEYGTGPCGPSCSRSSLNTLGSLGPPLNSLKWKCTSGCLASNLSLHDINYFVTDASPALGWEIGENIFFDTFNGTGPFEVSLDGYEWASSNGNKGKLTSTVDLGLRNDTGNPLTPNASPVAAAQAIVGIQVGCVTTLDIPVDDPDADTLVCRLATPAECGAGCTNLPNVQVDQRQCRIKIDATSSVSTVGQLYRVALMIEDYPDYTILVGTRISSIRKPLNKIPYQFSVKIVQNSGSCLAPQSKFVYPVHPDGYRFSYSGIAQKQLETAFYLQFPRNQSDFVLSLPAGMTYSILGDDFNRINVQRVKISLKPDRLFRRGDQWGDTMICVWGRNPSGVTSTDKRCITAIVSDFDECSGGRSFCKNNGTCVNLYRRWTCKCGHGFKPKDCSASVTCADFPCKNNGTCADTGKLYVCSCARGFSGLDCEYKRNVSSTVAPSVSSSFAASKRKVSKPGHGGLDVLSLSLAVLGGLLGALVILGCCCWLAGCLKRKKDKRRLIPSPVQNANEPSTDTDEIQNDRGSVSAGTCNRKEGGVLSVEECTESNTPMFFSRGPHSSDLNNSRFQRTLGNSKAANIGLGTSTRRLPIRKPSASIKRLIIPNVEATETLASNNIYAATKNDPLIHQTGLKVNT